MKKAKYKVLIAALIIIMASCNNKAESGTGTEKEEVHTDEESSSANKEVELNEAQYLASEISFGTFSTKNLSEVINATGYTKLPPQNQAEVSVYVSGIVKTINIIEGQYVKKGQVIATIESPEFTRIQEQYLTTKSNLEYLRLEYERQRILSSEGVNSQKQFQKAKADYDAERARYNSLLQQLNTMNINPNHGAVSTVPVVAPISGYVTEVDIKIGSNVQAGTALTTIVDNSKLHVDLLVYEKDLQKVKVGQKVRFVLTNQDNSEIIGQIFSIGKAFENETKSVAVHADIPNEKQQLISGMYVNALIDVGRNTVNALPSDAIVKAEGREFIFILEGVHEETVQEDKHEHKEGEKHEEGETGKKEKKYHFQRIEVKTGTSQLGFVQVTALQELPADAQIVLKGAYYIQSHLLKSEGGGGHDH